MSTKAVFFSASRPGSHRFSWRRQLTVSHEKNGLSALIYLQCADHFPLLDYHLATWRRLVRHINIMLIRSANCELKRGSSGDVLAHFGNDCFEIHAGFLRLPDPFLGKDEIHFELLTLVHAPRIVPVQILERVILGRGRE